MDGDSTTGTARPGSITTRSRIRREATEMTAEEREQADLTDLHCLNMCIAVLERAHGVSSSVLLNFPYTQPS